MRRKVHPAPLVGVNSFASSLDRQGKYAEAEVMSRQMLQLQEMVCRKDDPATLASVKNLAITLDLRGKYVEAEMIHLKGNL